MDLHSSLPFWLFTHGSINSYPSLNDDLKTDIAIIGAGISGALVANRLCKDGQKVVVIDRRHVGTGSTAASTALLQYEIDTPLHKLITMVGEKNATRSYELCRKTIDDMGNLCEQLKVPGLFLRKPSFQYASYKKDVSGLENEFQLRRNANFSIQWLDEKISLTNLVLQNKPAFYRRMEQKQMHTRLRMQFWKNGVEKDYRYMTIQR